MPTLLESPTVSKRKSKTFRAVFINTTVSGVAYYRMASLAWAMRSWPNVETVVWPYSKNTTIQNPWQVDMIDEPFVRQRLDYLCEKADVVVWQMLDFDHSFDFWMDMRARHQKPFLMEIDDYINDVPVENAGYEQMQPGSRRCRIAMEQMRQSDALIVSTPYLAEQYKGRNEHIYVIPNSMDLKAWDAASQRKTAGRLRIGWIGGGTHNADLEMVKPALEEIVSKNENVWFYCIHGAPKSFEGIPRFYWTRKWSKINLYPRFMASFKFDIGIAPLVDNNFNRGKSNLRWLEYSALKVPCVASPLPDFVRSITEGKTGFLANDLEAWKTSLQSLIDSEDLRINVGKQAYQEVKERFNVRKTSTQYMRLLKGISDGDLLSADAL